MNIIKEFQDDEMAHSLIMNDHFNMKDFYWGLGDDGNLYFKITHIDHYVRLDYWSRYNCNNASFHVPFKSMCRIVSEFKHLLVFT